MGNNDIYVNHAERLLPTSPTLLLIRAFFGIGPVEGVIEADEVFFAESFKGAKPSKMPRKSRKRGKQVKKRGII